MKQSFLYLLIFFLTTKLLAQNTMAYTSEERDFKHGLELFDKQLYASSVRFFQKFVENNPNSELAIDAQFYITSSYMMLENDNSEKYLNAFVSEHPGHSKVTVAYFQAGMFYYKKGKYKEAIKNLEEADLDQLTSEEKADALFSLGYSYLLEKDYEKSKAKFEKVEYLGSKYKYAASYYLGYIYFKLKEYDKSTVSFERAGQNETYSKVVPFMVINILYHQKKYDEVIKKGKEVLESKKSVTNKNDIVLLTGTSYYEIKDYENALKYLKPYADKKKASSSTKYRVGHSAYVMKDYKTAEKYLKQTAEKSDSVGQVSAYYLGHTYLNFDNRRFAYNSFLMASNESFSKAIQAEAIFNLAKLAYEARRFDEAIDRIKTLQSDFSEYKFPAPSQTILAEAYLNSNNLDDAIAYIEKMKYPNKRINEVYKEVTYLKGVSLFNQKKYTEAKSYFGKSLKTIGENKFNEYARFWRGECYALEYNWDKARNDYAAVFAFGESSKYYRQARFGAAYTYFNQKLDLSKLSSADKELKKKEKYVKALGHFEYYLSSSKLPSKDVYYGDALLRSADCYYRLKKYEEAVFNYDKAIRTGVQYGAYANYQKGVIESVLGQYDESVKSFDVVINKYPNSVYVEEAMYRKGLNYYEVGEYKTAIVYYSDYINKFNSTERAPIVMLERGVAYSNVKNYKKALVDFDKVLYDYCTDTVYSSQALKGCQISLAKLDKNAEYETRLEQYFKCGGQGKEKLTFEAARGYYRSEKYELAIKSLEKFLVEYPESVFTYEVDFLLGMANHNLKNSKEGKQYLYIVSGADQKYHYQEALIVLSEIYKAEGDWKLSNEINEKLLAITLSEQKKQLILLELIVGNYEVADYEKVLKYTQEVFDSEGTLIYAYNKSALFKGLALYEMRKTEEALDEFVLLSNNSKDVYAARAHFMVAQIQYDQEKYMEALETLKSLLATRRDFVKWYGEGYVLASMCYVQLGEVFQGKSYLKDVIKNYPDDSVKKQAQIYLEEIENGEETEKDASGEFEEVEQPTEPESKDSIEETPAEVEEEEGVEEENVEQEEGK